MTEHTNIDAEAIGPILSFLTSTVCRMNGNIVLLSMAAQFMCDLIERHENNESYKKVIIKFREILATTESQASNAEDGLRKLSSLLEDYEVRNVESD